MNASESEKKLAAIEAVKAVKTNQVVGLGTGSSAFYAIHEVGSLVKQGYQITGVPTSLKTKALAESLNIPLKEIQEVTSIDVTIDGADEFTSDLMLIKGGGGALLREKLVASMSKQVIIITDGSKKVDKLGKFKVPLEVIPFATTSVLARINSWGGMGVIRHAEGVLFKTDQGNLIIDADFGLIDDPAQLAQKLDDTIGIVEHGLFINLASKVMMGTANGVKIFG